MKLDSRAHLFRNTSAHLGEGVLWHPVRKTLLWVDILGKRIFETSVSGKDDSVTEKVAPKMVGALLPTPAGVYHAVLQDGLYEIGKSDGHFHKVSEPGSFDTQSLRLNDAKCDPRGRLWAGSLSLKGESGKGALYRFTPKTGWQTQLTGVSISNGLAWSLDHRTLYYIDSALKAVQVFAYDLETGSLGARLKVFKVDSIPGLPDGCTLDAKGRLWIAHWDGFCVSCWDPESGRLLDQVHLPVSQVTSCTFGGERLDTLFITTAATELSAQQREEQPLAGQLFCANVGVAGISANLYEVNI